jgi:transposase
MAEKGKEKGPRERDFIAQRGQIIGLRTAGKTVKEISDILGVHRFTVMKWIRRHEEEGDLSSRPRSGRPRATSVDIDNLIINEAREAPLITATRIMERVQPGVSVDTVRRRLVEGGLKHHIPASKEELSAANIRQRLQFAAEHA